MLNIAENLVQRTIHACGVRSDRLPSEHSLNEAAKIYINRFLVFLAMVLLNFLLLGFFTLISS